MIDHKGASLKIAHLCFADARGGAAIGARRLHQSMQRCGVNSKLYVVEKYGDDETVIRLPNGHRRRKFVRELQKHIVKRQHSDNPIVRTLNVVPVGTASTLNKADVDIVQMHWVGADTISIGEIVQIEKPVVWKLPDMWAFSGAEHYLLPGDKPRYKEGYSASNRQIHESGLDLDRLIWLYKRKRWKNANFSVVGPSSWITHCAKESILFRNLNVRHILNPLDLDLYDIRDSTVTREKFALPVGKKLIGFGAFHATRDTRKGLHHLREALAHLASQRAVDDIEFVVIGADGEENEEIGGIKVNYLGVIHDEDLLVDAYNAVDLFVLPTEADNLPNVVKEATCCGVPCVGFRVGGMPDMVDHLDTGYLAAPFDTRELAEGIVWTIENVDDSKRKLIRARAESKHAQPVAVAKYLDFYQEILAERQPL